MLFFGRHAPGLAQTQAATSQEECFVSQGLKNLEALVAWKVKESLQGHAPVPRQSRRSQGLEPDLDCLFWSLGSKDGETLYW